MMKKYIAPEFRVAMFHKETVSTNENATNVSQIGLQYKTAEFMANQAANTAKVRKSIDFKSAIDFK